MTETTIAPKTNTMPAVADESGAPTPMTMLNHAVATGASIEVLERLMGLQERWEANQARKAFTEAFAAFKSEAITIGRNRTVTDGPLKGKSYAELVSFVEAVTPPLSKHGLSASWSITKDEKDWIEVTCTIEHVLGGSKKVSLGGPPDTGGAKNAIQARASTVTYLERHTLKAACGLAEQGDDKDGNGTADLITAEQADELKQSIDDAAFAVEGPDADYAAWTKSLIEYLQIESFAKLPAKDFDKAKAAIVQAKKARGKK